MKKNQTFEEAMEKLEDSVKKLESGSLGINEAMKEFEEALSLVRFLSKVLDDAEQKVKLLVEGKDGAVTDAPFEAQGDEA